MPRAAAAGYEALVFTTDANVFGSREWDRRSYLAPGKPTLRAASRHAAPSRLAVAGAAAQRHAALSQYRGFLPPGAASAVGGSTVIPQLFDATITWDDFTWIRELLAAQAV